MIEPGKLFQLEGGQRRRKLALTFGALERDIAGIAEKGASYDFPSMTRAAYTKHLAEIVLRDPSLSEAARAELRSLIDTEPFDERRLCNCARNHLLAIIGALPAEWDLVIAPHASPFDENGVVRQRDFYAGMCVYAEDIRSPFNLGSIFRSAEAFGVDKVYLSPFCADPRQTRALRSGMGCIETLGWERKSLADLPHELPIFALETGGMPISEFDFPSRGICLIGSEELGLSPQALDRAEYGRVSIPMKGLKASLNVGVALGVLLASWTQSVAQGKAI